MGEYSPEGSVESSGFERGPEGPQGPRGATGVAGAIGPAGPAGTSGSSAYVETFDAAPVWIVNHNLGHYPHTWSVANASQVELDVLVQHVTPNQSRVYFDAPIAGVVRFT